MKLKKINASIGILINRVDFNNPKIYMQTRLENGPLSGYLEFPGGKIEPKESAKDTVIREFFEETKIDIKENKIEFFKEYDYQYPDRCVKLNTFLIWSHEKQGIKTDFYPLNMNFQNQHFEGKVLKANEVIIDELCQYLHNHPQITG
jgi:mutator protein MutT